MKVDDCSTCRWHDIYWEEYDNAFQKEPREERTHECVCPAMDREEREEQHEACCLEFTLYEAGAKEECSYYRKYERSV